MESDHRSNEAETGMVPEAANIRIICLPWIYLGAIALGVLLHLAFPVRCVPLAVSVPIGATMPLPVGLFALQGFCASLAVGNSLTTTASCVLNQACAAFCGHSFMPKAAHSS